MRPRLIEELFSLAFLEEATNVVLIGPNGLGKTMLLKNLAHQAILHGHSARFTLASDMLHDLAAQDSTVALARRLRRYTRSTLLAIDEVGYLSYDPRYADLLFEVITRRYEQQRPILLTTNKAFGEWNQVFPNATCVVALVDRLLHRAEIVALEGKSYRFKEAQERAARKSRSRTPHANRAEPHAPTQRLAARVPAPRTLHAAAAKLVAFLHELTDALERHYGAQIKHHYETTARAARAHGRDDPPF